VIGRVEKIEGVHVHNLFSAVSGNGLKVFIPAKVFAGLILQIKDTRQTIDDQVGKLTFFDKPVLYTQFLNTLQKRNLIEGISLTSI
jgi:hypothetical protein